MNNSTFVIIAGGLLPIPKNRKKLEKELFEEITKLIETKYKGVPFVLLNNLTLEAPTNEAVSVVVDKKISYFMSACIVGSLKEKSWAEIGKTISKTALISLKR